MKKVCGLDLQTFLPAPSMLTCALCFRQAKVQDNEANLFFEPKISF
jgi:hypothetical protein